MSDKFFLDTNILVYTFDKHNSVKRDLAQRLVQDALAGGQGVISYQVVQEFLNTAIRKFQTTLSPDKAKDYLSRVLMPLCAHYPSADLYTQALAVHHRYQYNFYDSLIIAAACEAEATVLYTVDMHHGQHIGSLTITNPFLADYTLNEQMAKYVTVS